MRMKMLKNTVFDVYKYMNSSDWSIHKYCNTTLFQSFTHLGYDFEVRISKDDSKFFICNNGVSVASNGSVSNMKKQHEKCKEWYLNLNWELFPECMSEIDEKLKFINEN